jgi:hypothetical protein
MVPNAVHTSHKGKVHADGALLLPQSDDSSKGQCGNDDVSCPHISDLHGASIQRNGQW